MGIIGTITAKNTGTALTNSPISGNWIGARGTATGVPTNFIGVTGNIGQYNVQRGFLLFDTTTIPQGALINSVIVVHPLIGNLGNTSGGYSVICTHTATDPIASAGTGQTTNFSALQLSSGTSYGSVALAVLGTAVGTIGIPLDANGIANLSRGGTTRYAVISNADLINSDPGTHTLQYTTDPGAFQLIVDYNPVAFMTTHSKFWGGA